MLLAWGLLVACIKNKSTLKGMGVIAPSSGIWVWGKYMFALCRPSGGGGGWVQQDWVIESKSTVGKRKGQGMWLVHVWSGYYVRVWQNEWNIKVIANVVNSVVK